MILAFLKRRWWLTQNRFMTTMVLAFTLPVFLHLSINAVMKHVIVRSINEIPYEHWVYPGLVMLIAAITLFPLLYRDFFDLRIHKKSLLSITLTPITKRGLIFCILVSALVEATVFALIGMLVLALLVALPFSWLDYSVLILAVVVYAALLGNIFISLSLLVDRISTYLAITLIAFVGLPFGSGLLVEFEFYPLTLGRILEVLPTGLVVGFVRGFLFENSLDWLGLVVVLAVIGVWTLANGLLLRQKLHQ